MSVLIDFEESFATDGTIRISEESIKINGLITETYQFLTVK